MHRSQIDIIDTAHIDSSHFCTVRHLAECKCFDTACRAELVTNNVFVEKIFLCFLRVCIDVFLITCIHCYNRRTRMAGRFYFRNYLYMSFGCLSQ